MPAPKGKRYHYVYYSYEPWGRGYIGVRSCNCLPCHDEKYFGTFKDKTFNPTCKIILNEFNDRKTAQLAEIQLHSFFNVDINPHFANKCKARTTGFSCGYKQSSDVIEKRRKKMLGRRLSDETKKKIGEANRKSLKGKKLPSEVKAKISRHFKGKKLTEEHKRKIKEAQVGRKFSEKHLKNLRAAGKPNQKSIILKDLTTGEVLNFSSIMQASKAIGVPKSTIHSAIGKNRTCFHHFEICAIVPKKPVNHEN
jgi:hypothetical protein